MSRLHFYIVIAIAVGALILGVALRNTWKVGEVACLTTSSCGGQSSDGH